MYGGDDVDRECASGEKSSAPNLNGGHFSLLMINSLFVVVVAVVDHGKCSVARLTVLFVVAGQDRSHERMTHCANGKNFYSGMALNLKSDFARRNGTTNPHLDEDLEVYRFRLCLFGFVSLCLQTLCGTGRTASN